MLTHVDSRRYLQTRIQKSKSCMQNRDSSENTICCHRHIQFWLTAHHYRRAPLCSSFNERYNNGRYAYRLYCCIRRRAVCEDTCAEKKPIYLLKIRDVTAVICCKADLLTYKPSRDVRLLRSCMAFSITMWNHGWLIRITVLGCQQMGIAT